MVDNALMPKSTQFQYSYVVCTNKTSKKIELGSLR